MSEARQQILRLLQEGKITVDEAAGLLHSLGEETAVAPAPVPATEQSALEGDIIPSEPPPDMNRYRRFWQYPFFISLVILIGAGLWLRAVYQTSAGAITLGFICLWSLFMLAFVLTALAFMSRRSTWIHVRVHEKNGHRIAISLPLPLRVAGWGITFAEGLVPVAARDKLAMASEFLQAARENLTDLTSDPIVINVDDDDGDQVQVYIG